MRWDPEKQLCKGKSSLHMPCSKSRILSHHIFFHHNPRNSNLRLGKAGGGVVAAYLHGPLNVPSRCCWHSSSRWSLQMSSLPCTKTLKASSLQWKALYPLFIFCTVLSWVASNTFTFHMDKWFRGAFWTTCKYHHSFILALLRISMQTYS